MWCHGNEALTLNTTTLSYPHPTHAHLFLYSPPPLPQSPFLFYISTQIQVGYTRVDQLHPTVLQKVKRENPAEYSIVTHPYQYTR